ncbi:helix-turn-helix transcriptional regulator [Aurantimonas sp. 22II-16-19i]|uniref:helix-turn-helix transcriptional regulator n=1 Tax=Aurantimonas sp. 22II-16-19i TaxID=1317114 RepID=UPI0009F7B7C6|nr:helix-turn-helix transcriptional regulator [Aurantimonas sp. 22II-16-19i]ORE93265.1 LuxR family transcriptional regulator [Aurantimonas sp. 22II-16-19i]
MRAALSELRNRIYDAVFEPGLWLEVLRETEDLSGAAGSSMTVYEAGVPLRHVSTALTSPLLDRFIGEGLWRTSCGIDHSHRPPASGFVRIAGRHPSEFLAFDAQHALWAESGLSIQVEAIIAMANDHLLAVTFAWRKSEATVSQSYLDTLASVHPDLVRSVGMAVRLTLEADLQSLATLAGLGVPAALLTASGRIWAANGLFGALNNLFALPSSERPRVLDRVVDALLHSALVELLSPNGAGQGEGNVRSVAVPATESRPPTVMHLVLLASSKPALFSFGRVLLLVSPLSRSDPIMSPAIVSGLFNLTPSEAKLALWLATGGSLKAGAARFGITEKSARTYLERIFRKTRTASQAELKLLLNSGPISRLCRNI